MGFEVLILSFVQQHDDGRMDVWLPARGESLKAEGFRRADEAVRYCLRGGCINIIPATLAHIHNMDVQGPMERGFVERIASLSCMGLEVIHGARTIQ